MHGAEGFPFFCLCVNEVKVYHFLSVSYCNSAIQKLSSMKKRLL